MRSALYLLALLVVGCSSTEKKSEPAADVNAVGGDSKSEEYNLNSIVGNNIWVRDTPVTGEVVMKLNEGDKFEVLSKGHFEIIGGNPNYWYKIKYEEKEGWLFGSQSNIPLPVSYEGNTLKEAWDNFREKIRMECEQATAAPDEGYYGCEWKDLGRDSFSIKESYEAWEEYTYKFKADTSSDLWFVPVKKVVGAAELSTGYNTLVGFKSDQWRLFETIDGVKSARVALNNNQDIYLFVSDNRTAMWGEQKIFCWKHDKQGHTFQKRQLVKELELWDLAEQDEEVQTDSLVDMSLKNSGGKVMLSLSFSVSSDEELVWDAKAGLFRK